MSNWRVLQIGAPRLLPDDEMERVLEKFAATASSSCGTVNLYRIPDAFIYSWMIRGCFSGMQYLSHKIFRVTTLNISASSRCRASLSNALSLVTRNRAALSRASSRNFWSSRSRQRGSNFSVAVPVCIRQAISTIDFTLQLWRQPEIRIAQHALELRQTGGIAQRQKRAAIDHPA